MALSVFIVISGIIGWLTGNLHFGPSSGVETESADASEHSVAREHDAKDAPDGAELEKAICEHGVHTIECDNCRFELGMVKLHPSVAKALIETDSARKVNDTTVLKLTGQVQLDKTTVVDIVPTGSGRVQRVDKLLGQDVSEGDVLAVLHSADLGQAKAQYLEAQARLELAASTFDREKDLYEKKVSSKVDYLSAMNELNAAKAYHAAAEKRLRLFGLDAEQIQAIKNDKDDNQFAELILRAPRAGTVIAQDISAGSLVDTTQTLYTIADLSNLWVWSDLYEKDLPMLHELLSSGASIDASVRVKAFGQDVFTWRVDLIGSTMDEHTRTIRVRIQVVNEHRKLRPGMFAQVEIIVPRRDSITVVPSTAVLSDDGNTFVFQHWKDDLWVRRDVVVGRRLGDLVQILDGVNEGDTVVARGGFMLKSDILREKMGAGCAD
jgi:cobalt-zinc-cadmium efflux system membrane fusion protein